MTLRELVKAKGYTQVTLAERLGVSQPTVWGWLNGRTIPQTKDLPRIAKALGVSITTLIKTLNKREEQ